MYSVHVVYAGDLSVNNAGFVPANIWYSKDPFFTGDTVRVYTIVFNGSSYGLSGGVEFLDNGTVIGTTNFSIAGSGRVQDLWVDWKAGSGAHTITARLVNVIADGPNGKQSVTLSNIETGKSERVISADPTVVALQTKALEQKVADAKNQTIDAIAGVASTVGGAIPAPVKESVSAGVNILEKFRIGEGAQLTTLKENQAKVIEAMKAQAVATSTAKKSTDIVGDVSNATKEPFAYIVFAAYTLLQFIFQYQILFYGLILYGVYRLIKLVARKIRDRNN